MGKSPPVIIPAHSTLCRVCKDVIDPNLPDTKQGKITTAFPAIPGTTTVTFNGMTLCPGKDYQEDGNGCITLNSWPDDNDTIMVEYYTDDEIAARNAIKTKKMQRMEEIAASEWSKVINGGGELI